MKLRILITALVAGAIACGANAQVYRWVDASGKVHYSDHKPPDSKATTMAIQSESSLPKPPDQNTAADAGSGDQPPPSANDAVNKELAALNKQRCETAKAVVERYKNAPYLSTKDADGNELRLSPEDEAAERVKVQREMEQACGTGGGQ